MRFRRISNRPIIVVHAMPNRHHLSLTLRSYLKAANCGGPSIKHM
jgi:hypothetical protein